MGGLGNRDAGARRLANLGNLAAGATNDAANHVSGNADVLCLNLLAILVVGGRAARGSVRVGAAREGTGAAAVAKVRAVAGAHDAGAAVLAAAIARSGEAAGAAANGTSAGGGAAGLGADHGVVEDGASTALPVVDEALANLPEGALDALRGALDFDDALGGLGEHLLLGDHANARDVLDVLDLETLATNDGAHLVVGDEEFDGWAS